jgi:hypothetical protein
LTKAIGVAAILSLTIAAAETRAANAITWNMGFPQSNVTGEIDANGKAVPDTGWTQPATVTVLLIPKTVPAGGRKGYVQTLTLGANDPAFASQFTNLPTTGVVYTVIAHGTFTKMTETQEVYSPAVDITVHN